MKPNCEGQSLNFTINGGNAHIALVLLAKRHAKDTYRNSLFPFQLLLLSTYATEEVSSLLAMK